MKDLTSIKTLCKELDVSPRTLRYYEHEGIIVSYQQTPTAPRYYNFENIDKIKKILFFRKIGMSVADIKEIFNEGSDMQEAIYKRRAFLLAESRKIEEKCYLIQKTIDYLNEGKNIFEIIEPKNELTEADGLLIAKTKESTEYLLNGEFKKSRMYYDERMKYCTDPSMLEAAWNRSVKGIGDFIKIEKTIKKDNIIFVYSKFTKLYLRIKYVCHDGLFSGIWFDYIELE